MQLQLQTENGFREKSNENVCGPKAFQTSQQLFTQQSHNYSPQISIIARIELFAQMNTRRRAIILAAVLTISLFRLKNSIFSRI